MVKKKQFNFVIGEDQLDRIHRRAVQENKSVGSLIREAVDQMLIAKTYNAGLLDAADWLRKTNLISGKDLPDGRTHQEFVSDEMMSELQRNL